MAEKVRLQIKTVSDPETWVDVGAGPVGEPVPVTDIEGNLTAGYSISDTAEIATIKYYGFLKADGGWYIMQKNAEAFRYIKGDSGYTTSWTGKAGLTYDYYNIVF